MARNFQATHCLIAASFQQRAGVLVPFVIRRVVTSPRLIVSYCAHPTGVIITRRALADRGTGGRRRSLSISTMLQESPMNRESLKTLQAFDKRARAPLAR